MLHIPVAVTQSAMGILNIYVHVKVISVCLHIVYIVLKIILHIPYHIYEFLHQVIVRHFDTMLTWHECSEHDIITNRLLIRIISVAYTVL